MGTYTNILVENCAGDGVHVMESNTVISGAVIRNIGGTGFVIGGPPRPTANEFEQLKSIIGRLDVTQTELSDMMLHLSILADGSKQKSWSDSYEKFVALVSGHGAIFTPYIEMLANMVG